MYDIINIQLKHKISIQDLFPSVFYSPRGKIIISNRKGSFKFVFKNTVPGIEM